LLKKGIAAAKHAVNPSIEIGYGNEPLNQTPKLVIIQKNKPDDRPIKANFREG
jgi:hypothetical protein